MSAAAAWDWGDGEMDGARHAGRVAIVTGAGSSIGRAAAVRLALDGAAVVCADPHPAALRATAAEIEDGGGEATMMTANLAEHGEIRRVVDRAIAGHGHVDLLANVAGVDGWALPDHQLDNEAWDRVLAVNLLGTMRLCRELLPLMLEHGEGLIVNIAPGAGKGDAAAAAAVSRHALIGLTRSIAWLYRSAGIRCNAVCPDGIESGPAADQALPEREGRRRPLERPLVFQRLTVPPGEVASLLSWLTSPEAADVNGAIMSPVLAVGCD
jgi:NAD(P)-dependent dehydrogenase (short-subunit alcohol dehydrogenase family)